MSTNDDYFSYVEPDRPSSRALVPKQSDPRDKDASFRPSRMQRDAVEMMAGFGLQYREICLLINNPATGRPIEVETLIRCFPDELQRGEPQMKATLAGKVFGTAYGNAAEYDENNNLIREERKPNPRLLEFLAQTKLGWKKTVVLQNDPLSQDGAGSLGDDLRKMFKDAMEMSQKIMGGKTSPEHVTINQNRRNGSASDRED